MSLSYEQTMSYRYDKQQRSNIVMIAVSSVGIALGLALLAGSIKRSVSGTSTTAWRLLAPTSLLLAGSFAAPLAAGVKSIQLDKSEGRESYRDFSTYAAAAVVTSNLFSIMLLVTGRVAFWEVAQVTQLLQKHKATKITMLIIDCILLAAGVGSMLAMTHRAAEYGACVEQGCSYSTHIGIVALDNAMFGFGFPAILMIAIAHLMVCGPAAYGLFAKRAGITSPLLNRLNKVVVPAFGIYLVTAIVFVAVAGSIGGDSYELWTMYYVSIPYLLTQAIVMFALQNALRGYPMQASLDVPLGTKAAEA